jgi:hypothetical protein
MSNSTQGEAERRIWYARVGGLLKASEIYSITLRARLRD